MASNNKGLLDTEQMVLGVLLNDSHAIIPVMGVLEEPDAFSLPLHQAVYSTILTLTKENVVPNVHTVAARLPSVSLDKLQELASHFNTKANKEVLYLADIVAHEAQWRRLNQALADAQQMIADHPADLTGAALLAGEMAFTAVERRNERDASVSEVGKRLDSEIATLSTSGLLGYTTGQHWLDDKTGGLCPSHVWIVSAPYKGRKTTLARNLVLSACMAGASVDVFALEGNQAGTLAGLWAMAATKKLHTWGCPEEMFLSETFVMRGKRTQMQQQALADARKELDRFNLRIYDGRDGIGDAEKIAQRVKRDRFMFGLNVFVLDYLQLLGSGKLFDRLEASTHTLQKLIGEQEVTGVMLAQLNEAAIWSMKDDDNDTYSPGVKGGGDPAAAADFLIRTQYDGANTPDVLKVNLKLARHAQPGTCRYQINAQSGVILSDLGEVKKAG